MSGDPPNSLVNDSIIESVSLDAYWTERLMMKLFFESALLIKGAVLDVIHSNVVGFINNGR